MLTWRSGLVAALLMGLVGSACGMRGGSQATIIEGMAATGAGIAATVAGGGSGQSLPAGTRLIASAPGITATTIRLGTIQDISGPVPGLFQTALDGVKAWVAYQNANGGLDGRRILLDTYDAGLNPTNFQQAMAEACSKDFALVGVMSTVDNAGADEGQSCDIPDITDNPTTPQAAAATDNFAAVPSEPNQYPTGWWVWLKQRFPSIVDKAAIMWPDEATTQVTGKRLEDTARSVGFNFVYATATPLLEANFLPYVQAMESKGVRYFAWQADYQSMARILQAMQQLNWRPTVIDASATTYNQEFLKTAGSAADGIYISLNVGLYSEAAYNPAIRNLLSWLGRAVPGHASPDIFDIYSWASGDLLAKAMAAAGYNPTREQVIAALRQVHNFSAGGLIAPMDPGDHKVSTCFEVITVKDGSFVRVYPTKPDSYECSMGTLYTDPNIAAPSLGS